MTKIRVELVTAIIEELERELATAIKAGVEAHSSATHSENVADNKYDTLALEAAYLAHGQSVRIAELQESINLYRRFKRPELTQQSSAQPSIQLSIQPSIQLGTLVDIENDNGDIQRLFIGPAAGGISIKDKPHIIRVITPSTPLGKALLNKTIDDEIVININHQSQYFTIIDIQ